MDRVARVAVGVLITGLALGVAGCGGDDPAPSPTPNPATTITITSTGTSPKNLTVPRGSQVTFVNSSIDAPIR